MTEHAPQSPFETALARRLATYADVPLRRLDANVAIATSATRAGRWSGLRLALPASRSMRLALALAVVAASLAAAVLVAGMVAPLLRGPGLLVYASSDGGLYAASADGTAPHKIRDGHFGTVRISPDGRFVAVVRDPDIVEVLESDGTLIEALQPAQDDFAWAPGQHAGDDLAVVVDRALLVMHLDVGDAAPPLPGETLRVVPPDNGIGRFVWISPTSIAWQPGPPARLASTLSLQAAEIRHLEHAIEAIPANGLTIVVADPTRFRSADRLLLSPDGTSISIVARQNAALLSDLAIVPVGGGTLASVATQLVAGAWVTWAADGRSVVSEDWDPGAGTHLDVIPLDGSDAAPLFAQAPLDAWLLVDDSPVALGSAPMLIGKVTSPADGGRLANAPVMDLYLLSGGTTRPVAFDVLAGDVVRP